MSRFSFAKTKIDGVYIIEAKPIHDERGYFERFFCANDFKEIGFDEKIAQINHSKTVVKGSIRGFHYQTPPFCEIKIVRCIKGAILDVALDIRKNSPTYLQYVSVELNEENNKYLYIPKGCAHGFQTLKENTELIYMVSEFYNIKADSVINPFDGSVGMKWPLELAEISQKDKEAPSIKDSKFEGLIL